MKPIILSLSLCFSTSLTLAQYPVLGSTSNWMLSGLTSLSIAGPKFIGWGPNGNVNDASYIYNLDLTLYRAMPLPPLPAGWAFSQPVYVTEALFDTDPATIEYMVIASGSGPAQHDARVYREDGTLLFSAPSSHLQANGWSMPPIISTTIAGSFMVLHDLNAGTTVYHLPGQLPCNDCSGMAMATPGDPIAAPANGFNILPNPAIGVAQFTYDRAPEMVDAELLVHAINGAEVMRMPIDGTGRQTIALDTLPAASYLCRIVKAGQLFGAVRLVVLR